MRDLLDLLDGLRALEEGQEAALVTVVEVIGSSYRREGARLLWVEGRVTGLLSSGCLERNVTAEIEAALSSGHPRNVTYDMTDEADLLWGTGSGCPGRVTLLVEPLDRALRTTTRDWLEALVVRRRTVRQATRFATDAPSAHAPLGERCVVDDGPSAPPHESLRSALRRLDLPDARASRPGEAPAGERFLLEAIPPPIQLVLVGAERDAPPLLRLARELGWSTSVLTPRPLDPALHAALPELRVAQVRPGESGAAVTWDERTAVLFATHRYLDDLAYLTAVAGRPVGYLGILGPRARRRRILDDVARVEPRLAGRLETELRGPAGLDLGGRAPADVALSIVAEIQATFARRDARPLATHDRPIASAS